MKIYWVECKTQHICHKSYGMRNYGEKWQRKTKDDHSITTRFTDFDIYRDKNDSNEENTQDKIIFNSYLTDSMHTLGDNIYEFKYQAHIIRI